jgi:hypothetical protein
VQPDTFNKNGDWPHKT